MLDGSGSGEEGGGGQGGRCYNDVVTVLTEPVLDGSDSGKGVGGGGGGWRAGGPCYDNVVTVLTEAISRLMTTFAKVRSRTDLPQPNNVTNSARYLAPVRQYR